MKRYKIKVWHIMAAPPEFQIQYKEFCKEYNVTFAVHATWQFIVVTEEEFIMIKLKYPTSSSFIESEKII